MSLLRSPLNKDFEYLVEHKRAEWGVPGLAVSVVHHGESFSSAYGIATYPETPVTPSTLFSVASTSKAFLAAAWAQTIEADKEERTEEDEALAFSTPFCEICPDDFVLEDEWATENLTIEDALCHRTGLSAHQLFYGGAEMASSQEITRNLRYLPLRTSPRTKWEYCNLMYIAASHALEVAQTRGLGEILYENIWMPLRMGHTFMDIRDAMQAADAGDVHLATPYTEVRIAGYDCHTFRTEDNTYSHALAGAGSIVSNVGDFAKWMICLLNTSEPLSKSIVNDLWEPRSIVASIMAPFDGPVTYCLGWFLGTYRREKVVFHHGSMAGSGSAVVLLPNRNWGTTIMLNIGVVGHLVALQLAFHLIDDLLQTPGSERADLEPTHRLRVRDLKTAASRNLAELDAEIGNVHYPPPVPLEACIGRYVHPAYRDLTFKMDKSSNCLVAEEEKRTWPFKIRIEHLSGDRWVSCCERLPYRGFETVHEAKFLLGKNGQVLKLGLIMEDEMPEIKFWFEKVQDFNHN